MKLYNLAMDPSPELGDPPPQRSLRREKEWIEKH